jgi:hypothetical protein
MRKIFLTIALISALSLSFKAISKDEKPVTTQNSADSNPQNNSLKEDDYHKVWKEALESMSPIYESTNKSVTNFGYLISAIVTLFSIIITIVTLFSSYSIKTTTQEQFEEFKGTLKKEELIKDIEKNIPEQIIQQVEKAIKEKFDKEYKDKIYVWTRDQVENTMGWSLEHREIMQSYQRKEAQKIAGLITEKFKDSEFSGKVYDVLLQNSQDTLTMYKVLSGDIEIIKAGLMDFTAHPIAVFSGQLQIVKSKYRDISEIQEHIIKAENALLKMQIKDNELT